MIGSDGRTCAIEGGDVDPVGDGVCRCRGRSGDVKAAHECRSVRSRGPCRGSWGWRGAARVGGVAGGFSCWGGRWCRGRSSPGGARLGRRVGSSLLVEQAACLRLVDRPTVFLQDVVLQGARLVWCGRRGRGGRDGVVDHLVELREQAIECRRVVGLACELDEEHRRKGPARGVGGNGDDARRRTAAGVERLDVAGVDAVVEGLHRVGRAHLVIFRRPRGLPRCPTRAGRRDTTPGTLKVSAVPSGGKNKNSSVVAEIHGWGVPSLFCPGVRSTAVQVVGTKIESVSVSSSSSVHCSVHCAGTSSAPKQPGWVLPPVSVGISSPERPGPSQPLGALHESLRVWVWCGSASLLPVAPAGVPTAAKAPASSSANAPYLNALLLVVDVGAVAGGMAVWLIVKVGGEQHHSARARLHTCGTAGRVGALRSGLLRTTVGRSRGGRCDGDGADVAVDVWGAVAPLPAGGRVDPGGVGRAAGVSARGVQDLERGVNVTRVPRRCGSWPRRWVSSRQRAALIAAAHPELATMSPTPPCPTARRGCRSRPPRWSVVSVRSSRPVRCCAAPMRGGTGC